MTDRLFTLLLCTCVLASCVNQASDRPQRPDAEPSAVPVDDDVTVHPVVHGSVVLTAGDITIFIDPYDGAERYTGFGAPDLVLITHTHGDHLDSATLSGLDLTGATLVGPQAVIEANPIKTFSAYESLANGQDWSWNEVTITAVAAYNPPPKENFHPKGKFNGYVVDLDGERYYFSGDTEGVPEMRNLQDIDVAFVCMNLPYTMDIEQAASAVLDFAPGVVYPYHYRNQDGSKSDVQAFESLVKAENPDIEVRLENWYPEN